MMTLSPRVRLIGVACLAVLAGFLIGTFIVTIPAPTVRSVTQTDIGLSIQGTTAKRASVLVFGVDGSLLSVTRADAEGAFSFEALSPVTGTKNVFLRAVDGGWRASPPKTVSLEHVSASGTLSAASGSSTDDLPPLAIPPTSTRAKSETSTSTGSATTTLRHVGAIAATASVASSSVKSNANQTVTIAVKDEAGAFLSGATVTLIAHYPTEDVSYTAIATGSEGIYRAKFRVPDNIGAGTNVLVDVTASYQPYTSTARTVFSIR
jgi:hypothetical protein